MSKSLIYAANTGSQTTVATGTVVNFGSVVRRYGCNVGMSGGNVTVDGVGYYDVDINLTLSGSAGNAVVQLYKDGVAIPGAEATITVVADTNYAVSIPLIIRQKCCCESTLTVLVSGVPCTVSNASIEVIKQ